jgi:hypothetical protein
VVLSTKMPESRSTYGDIAGTRRLPLSRGSGCAVGRGD